MLTVPCVCTDIDGNSDGKVTLEELTKFFSSWTVRQMRLKVGAAFALACGVFSCGRRLVAVVCVRVQTEDLLHNDKLAKQKAEMKGAGAGAGSAGAGEHKEEKKS